MALVQAWRVSSLSDATSAVMSSTDTAPHLVISISRPGSEARLRSVFAHPWPTVQEKRVRCDRDEMGALVRSYSVSGRW